MAMRLILKSDIVAAAPQRWADAYRGYETRWRGGTDKQETTKALAALPPGFTAEQVNQIIGNNSWTENKCDECDMDAPVLVRIGDAPDYDARWMDLCPNCIRRAAETAALHSQGEAK